MNKYIVYFSILSFFIIGCNDENEVINKSNFGYDYFPIAIGKSWTYRSDSIIYKNGGTLRDTLKAFIKEEISATIPNNGIETYKLTRFFKRKESDPWRRINTWTIEFDSVRLILTEENIRLVKLVFPVKANTKWDSNIFVDKFQTVQVGNEFLELYRENNTRIDDFEKPYTFKSSPIPSITSKIVDVSSSVERRFHTETYGKGVGLLYKEMIMLNGNSVNATDNWEQKATKGFLHKLTLIDHN
jgi:hypothetical protein